MAAYVPTSWGRTRRPKEMEERLPDSSYNTSPTKANIDIIATQGDLHAGLDSTVAGENGYSTENQRYLHVLIKQNSTASKSVEIYAYNYAFKEWGPLLLKATHASGHEIATVTTTGVADLPGYYIFDISGIDRVAFVSAAPPTRIRAACSTF